MELDLDLSMLYESEKTSPNEADALLAIVIPETFSLFPEIDAELSDSTALDDEESSATLLTTPIGTPVSSPSRKRGRARSLLHCSESLDDGDDDFMRMEEACVDESPKHKRRRVQTTPQTETVPCCVIIRDAFETYEEEFKWPATKATDEVYYRSPKYLAVESLASALRIFHETPILPGEWMGLKQCFVSNLNKEVGFLECSPKWVASFGTDYIHQKTISGDTLVY